MTVYQGDIQTTARYELGNADSVKYPAAVINRAIDEVTSDFSRVMPEELSYETTYRIAVTSESWTSGAAHGTYVALANALIKYESEVVKNAAGTVTYTRDTDYTLDYINGKITTISGGAMAVLTAFLITYDRSGIAINISSISNFITPIRIETPLTVPQEEPSFWRWGNYLFIRTSEGNRNQDRAPDKAHIRVYYYGTWTAPTATVRGTFPAWLDDLMIKGVTAYCLGIKSRERGLQAIAYLQDSAGALRNTAGVYAKLEAALASLSVATTGPYARISAALGELATPHSDIGSAIAALKTATTGPYARIDTALAALLTAVTGPHAKIATALGLIGYTDINTAIGNDATPLANITTALGEIEALQDAIHVTAANTGDLKDAADVWADEFAAFEADLQANMGAGTNLVNTVNIGSDAAELRRRYAELFISKAQIWSDKRKDILHRAEIHIAQTIQRLAEAASWSRKAEDYLAHAQTRVSEGQLYITEAQEWKLKGDLYLTESDKWIQKGQVYLQEIQSEIQEGQLYIAETQEWIRKAETYLAEAQMWIQESQAYMAESQRFIELSNQENQLSIQLKTDSIERHADYWSILTNRVQMARPHGQVSTKQYTSPFTFNYGMYPKGG